MKKFTKAELIDFRARLERARDWELYRSGDDEGFTFICAALDRHKVPISDEVHKFATGW